VWADYASERQLSESGGESESGKSDNACGVSVSGDASNIWPTLEAEEPTLRKMRAKRREVKCI